MYNHFLDKVFYIMMDRNNLLDFVYIHRNSDQQESTGYCHGQLPNKLIDYNGFSHVTSLKDTVGRKTQDAWLHVYYLLRYNSYVYWQVVYTDDAVSNFQCRMGLLCEL